MGCLPSRSQAEAPDPEEPRRVSGRAPPTPPEPASSVSSEVLAPPGSPQEPWFKNETKLERNLTILKRVITSELVDQPHQFVSLENVGMDDTALTLRVVADEGHIAVELRLKAFTKERENRLGRYTVAVFTRGGQLLERDRRETTGAIALAKEVVQKIRQYAAPCPRPVAPASPLAPADAAEQPKTATPVPMVSEGPRVVPVADVVALFKRCVRERWPGADLRVSETPLNDQLTVATVLGATHSLEANIDKVGVRLNFELTLRRDAPEPVVVGRHSSQFYDEEHFRDSFERVVARMTPERAGAASSTSLTPSSSPAPPTESEEIISHPHTSSSSDYA